MTIRPNPKSITQRDKGYLLWLRTQTCAFCGAGVVQGEVQVVPAHKGGGIATKGPDDEAVPLCVKCHAIEHAGAVTFWKGRDRDKIARETYSRYTETKAPKREPKGAPMK